MKIMQTKYQTGMTLIELMLALVISSVLMFGVATVYVSSKRGYNIQDNLARQQENSRFSLQLLTQDLRMAGYPKTFVLEPIVAATTADGGGAANDTITLQYQSTTDCLGQPTPACADDASKQCAVNRYFINNNNLMCQGNGGAGGLADVIAEGVSNLQLLYGIDTDTTPDDTANKYVTWNNVTVDDRPKIVSVRFALLSQTLNDVKMAATNNVTYKLLDVNITPNDKLIHRVYSSTILLRNRLQ